MLAGLAAAILVAPAATPTIVRASSEDCEVIAAIGRAEAGWGRDGPDEPFVVDGEAPNGGIYREDCDWRALGLGPPTPAGAQGARFAIERPTYSTDHTSATAGVNFIVLPPPGQSVAPFIQTRTCRLEKREGRWRLLSCKTTAIT
jgi:hypothetical protein